jgi:hypothetical protein
LLDEGSIAYFQEDEDYYGTGPMINDDFICQAGLRDGEIGFCDRDMRMTPRGRQYRRMQSLKIRNADPKEAADPPPLSLIPTKPIVLKLIDLTSDDEVFIYGV